jgi:predicted GIY-YIG superfamily endonuclease
METVCENESRIDIYGIVNRANNKIYIGQTKQGYLKRFTQHLCPKGGCPALKNAIKKYGRNNFSCELLDIAYTQEMANEKEKMWIFLLGTYKHENGYNLSMGGEIGCFNEETLVKMSNSKKGTKNSFYGKHHTETAKAKMSAWKKEYGGKRGGHPRAKKIMCVETGIIYPCIMDAAIKTGANRTHIGQVANKQFGRKKAGGFSWEWV